MVFRPSTGLLPKPFGPGDQLSVNAGQEEGFLPAIFRRPAFFVARTGFFGRIGLACRYLDRELVERELVERELVEREVRSANSFAVADCPWTGTRGPAGADEV
jgi:hypothetical protein